MRHWWLINCSSSSQGQNNPAPPYKGLHSFSPAKPWNIDQEKVGAGVCIMSACGWLQRNQRNGEEQEWLGEYLWCSSSSWCAQASYHANEYVPMYLEFFKRATLGWSWTREPRSAVLFGIRPCRAPLPFIREAGGVISVTCEPWGQSSPLLCYSFIFHHPFPSASLPRQPCEAPIYLLPQAAFHSHLTSPPQPGGFLPGMWSSGCSYLCSNLYTRTSFLFIWCKFLSFWGFPIDLACNLAPQMARTHH